MIIFTWPWRRPSKYLISDRYQNIEGTDLGDKLTGEFVVVSMVSRPRSRQAKEKFHHLLTRSLAEKCGVPPADVVVSICANQDEDWNFGEGVAKFPTGDLPRS